MDRTLLLSHLVLVPPSFRRKPVLRNRQPLLNSHHKPLPNFHPLPLTSRPQQRMIRQLRTKTLAQIARRLKVRRRKSHQLRQS